MLSFHVCIQVMTVKGPLINFSISLAFISLASRRSNNGTCFTIVHEAKPTCIHMTSGKGIVGEQSLCFSWFQRSADQYVPEATYKLAQCYEDGWGCERDLQEAVVLYKEAAEGMCFSIQVPRSTTLLKLAHPNHTQSAERLLYGNPHHLTSICLTCILFKLPYPNYCGFMRRATH